jgi:hypothetical protein
MPSDEGALLLQLSADVRGMERQLERAQQVAKSKVNAIQSDFNRLKVGEKVTIGQGIKSDLAGFKSNLMSTAGSATGLGGALGALGPIGVGVSVGLVALAGALRQAKEAMDFADEIGDTATKLHVTTDQLQEYRFALRAAGGEGKDADAALGAFNVTLGKAQEGIPKAAKAFKALGLDPNQFRDGESALKAVAAKIEAIKNDPQKDAIIDQLGLAGMAPLIEQGSAAMEGLKRRAHETGNVMDAELIQRGGELKDQMDELSQKVDVQLKSAFISLGPVLLDLMKLAGDFAGTIARIADSMRSMENRTIGTLRSEAQSQRRLADARNPAAFAKVAVDAMTSGRSMGQVRGAYRARADALDWEADKKTFGLQNRPPPSIPHGGASLDMGRDGAGSKGKGGTHRSGGTDRSEQLLETARQALASALEHAASAQLSSIQDQISADERTADGRERLAADIDARSKIERDQLAVQTQSKLASLRKQRADLDAAEKQGKISHDKAEEARAAFLSAERATQGASTEQEALISRRAIADKLDVIRAAKERELQSAQDLNAEESRIAQNSSEMAKTSAQRRSLALAQLAREQQAERDALKAQMDRGELSPGEYGARASAMDRRQASDRAAVDYANPDPRQQGRRSAEDQASSIAGDIVQQDDMSGRYEAMYAQIEQMRKDDLISEGQAERAKAQIAARHTEERLAGASAFFGQMAQLSNSGNKKLAAIGKAAAIAQATIDGFAAVAKALASSPPPLNFAMAAAVGVTAAANVAKIAGVGFEAGGYTGSGGRSQVAGVVHGQEFVVNAPGTRRNRALLEAMNAGANLSRAAQPVGGRTLSMTVNPHLHMTVDVRGANGDAAIREIAGRAAAAAGQEAYQQAMRDMPGRMNEFEALGS